MKVLVTGGAGFIGSNFIRHLLSSYDDTEIVNLDLLTYAGRLENLQEVKDDPRHKFIRGDIRDKKVVESLMKEGFDWVANFAAETHVDRSVREAGSFVLTDAYGTYVLLDAARKFGVGRFIQISTDEVYGSIQIGSSKETDPANPSSPYSAGKVAGDYIVLAFHKTYGLPAIITRSSNNYGPFQHPEKLIPKLTLRALNDQFLPIYGNGEQIRDWLHVKDNCMAIDLVASKGNNGEIYNIAAGEEHKNIDVARSILRLLRKTDELIKLVPDRPGHDCRYSLDTTKTRNLGWSCRSGFSEGLRNTVSWYRNNRWWWAPLIEDEFFKSDVPWLYQNKG